MPPTNRRRSLATISLAGTLDEKLVAIAAAGFDAIELCEADVVASPASPEQLRARIEELGLRVALYQPFRDFEAVPAPLAERNLRRAQRKFELMQRLGGELLLVCSNVSAQAIADDALAAEQLAKLADLAAAHGIRVAYEALAWGRHVNTSEHAWQIVKAAAHPNLGVCLDSFHILALSTDLSPLNEIPAGKIFFVQLADAPTLAMDVLPWSRHHRCLPGQGGFDLTSFIEFLESRGYRGPLSLEIFNDLQRQASAATVAEDAMRSLLALEQFLARRPVSPVPADSLAAHGSVGGFAFAELAVGASSSGQVEQQLDALGFALTGQHRSKPVALWQQGRTSLVLNYGAQQSRHGSDLVRLSALGLQSVNPDATAARAADLLAAPLQRERGPAEAVLPAIGGPDGVDVLLCAEQRGAARGWRNDFLDVGEAVSDYPELRLDHVATWEPLEVFDETTLFHRAVLDLEPLGDHEICTPTGLVRSRVLSNDAGLQIVLNGPLVGRGSTADPELQHLAFRCRDALRAAVGMRERGLSVLAIGTNYYDDLESRFELPDRLLKKLRDLSVLYDRDSRGGELLHYFTPLLGGRLFFEVLERRGGYTGFGAANAQVRLMAQSASAQLV